MKLKHLSLANCGGFEQLEIDFESDLTLIAGVNGVGKSTLLRALAVLLSRTLPEFTPSRATPNNFTDDDIYKDRKSLEALAQIQVNDLTLHSIIQRQRQSEQQGDRFSLLRETGSKTDTSEYAKLLRDRTLTGSIDSGMQETCTFLAALKTNPNPPVAVYFTPQRHLPGQPRTLPDVKPFEPSIAYSGALKARDVELREFMHWFRTQSKLGASKEPHRLKVLDSLRTVVNQLIPEFNDLSIQEQPRLGFVVNKNGAPLYLHQLSDGERGLLALVFDLTRRLAIANHDSENPIAEGVGVVMIDEIELHLHPKWQREVLGRLRSIFKNCQFVVTTHSPLVLGEAEARCIRFLEFQEHKVVATVPSEAYGMDANRILQELMDAPIRNQKIEAELRQLFELIDEEDFQAARQKITTLQKTLGYNEPELTRAESLITFLDGKE